MYSLNSYKEQVYNLGSPQPSPSRSPLKSLPKTPAIITAVTPSQKRKTAVHSQSESPKKLKMMTPQQIQDMVTGLQSSMSNMTDKIDNFAKKLDAQEEKQEIINQNVNALSATFATFKETIENNTKVGKSVTFACA